ncbi:transposon Ty3-I Gag-Pol polyprotein [Trichonephila clavipes]|nr:transposon Ty3-I Gag-Pol polyprotein [Trichonephila clavipes]
MFFSSMDLRSGYWQIEIDEADREKTAFITPKAYTSLKSCRLVSEAGLKLNSKKEVSFAAQEVKILGHLVSSNGVRPDPDKIKAFLSSRRTFAVVAEKVAWSFIGGPEEVEAFNSLKKALTSDPVLGMYDERASTEIHTDASGYGIGAVLVQIQNNVEKVIAYASRTLTKAEKKLFHHRKGMSCHRMGYQQIPAVHIRKTLYCCN